MKPWARRVEGVGEAGFRSQGRRAYREGAGKERLLDK